jgi:Mg2+ and Co2+ transporter CorA
MTRLANDRLEVARLKAHQRAMRRMYRVRERLIKFREYMDKTIKLMEDLDGLKQRRRPRVKSSYLEKGGGQVA